MYNGIQFLDSLKLSMLLSLYLCPYPHCVSAHTFHLEGICWVSVAVLVGLLCFSTTSGSECDIHWRNHRRIEAWNDGTHPCGANKPSSADGVFPHLVPDLMMLLRLGWCVCICKRVAHNFGYAIVWASRCLPATKSRHHWLPRFRCWKVTIC